jgi:carbamoyl-phosphate synthase large subunit
MPNILLSCAGRRHYLAGYFRDALAGRGRVVGTDMDLTAPALAACDRSRQVPPSSAPDYLEKLITVIREEEVHLLFSLNDLEVELLSRNREAIEAETGALLYIPPLDTVDICADKWRTSTFAEDLGIPVPATFLYPADALAAIQSGRLTFPLIVKPRWGSASIGLFRAGSEEELHAAISSCRAAVAKSALAQFGLEESVIIQELLSGREYGVDILYGREGYKIGFTAKRKLAMRAGETDKAVTVDPERFAAVVERIAQNLPHRGNLDCDFLERDGELCLLEMNPRFGGGYPFTHLAGANHVAMLIADFEGKPLPPYGYDIGRAFSKFDTLTEVPAP